ncbi:MAG: caspase family protein [Thermoguttaceae bacterium]|nr:caspase family protein [Thermoguttaceae bacterium]
MSQTGKRFLSGLVNRVLSAKEARSDKRRERSLASRRLGMEPLEDRQLLAVDPTLLSSVSQAEISQAESQAPAPVDLTAIQDAVATTGSGVVITVDDTTFSNAASDDTTGTHRIVADLTANLIDRPVSASRMTWAATLANMLTYTGWSVSSSDVVDKSSTESAESQTLNYILSSFTNDLSNLAQVYAWFMGGSGAYELQGNDIWAQILPNSTNGGLYPATGVYADSTAYCSEFLAAEIASPLYGICSDYLDANYGVGMEIHYMGSTGDDVAYYSGQSYATWLTLWGYDYDTSYEPQDKEYYTAVYVSDPYSDKIERYTIEWNDNLKSYVFTNYQSNVAGRTPYIYSFTTIQRMPGYGVLTPDQYEPNNTPEVFPLDEAGSAAFASDLGKIDVTVPSGSTGAATNGNVKTLSNLTLYAEGSEDADGNIVSDPVDLYKFELTQNASYSDKIVVSYGDGYLSAPLKATLYECGVDGEMYPVDANNYGQSNGFYDGVTKRNVSYYTGADGKTYEKVSYDVTVKMAGLTAGKYYLRVEFADGVVGGVNTNYSVKFYAGFDDLYESNNSFEEVNALPVDSTSKHTANFGVLYGRKFVEDLVLKQYDYNVSETDWFRFEMTAPGAADSAVNVYYKSTSTDINDADLDFVLYRENPDDEYGRGYTMVDRSWEIMTDVETVSLEGLPPGVYYVKVVGNLAAEDGVFVNVEYKLEINPGVDPSLPPDLRAEVLPGNNWESPLVVAVERYEPSDTEVFSNQTNIGPDGNVYLNYSFSLYGARTKDAAAKYENVQLGMFINGVRVSAEDMRAAINAGGLVDTVRDDMLLYFCDGGKTLEAADPEENLGNTKFEFLNFNIGKINDPSGVSLASKYFDSSTFAANSIVIVINPDNYEYFDGFGEVVDNPVVSTTSLTYYNLQFYDGSTPVSISEGQTINVYRNGRLISTFVYGNAPSGFAFKNGDVVMIETVRHNYGVNVLYKETVDGVDNGGVYVAKEGVEGTLEYTVTNNVAASYFILDNLSEDVFSPNGSVTEVMNNENEDRENPDLGVVNIEYLNNTYQGADGEAHVGLRIDNLVITGEKDSTGAYIADWFKFQLITGAEDRANGVNNYSDAYIKIAMDEAVSAVNDPSSGGDLDLYLYKVEIIQPEDEPALSFDEAFERGLYRLKLVAFSKDVKATETIKFANYADDIDDGTYFVRVAGFNGAANRYSLEIGDFTSAGVILPTDPSEYFTDDNVSILNSIATVNWRVPATDYVSRVTISYREAGSDQWIEFGQYKPSVTSCKIPGLAPDTEYEFKLSVTNYFIENDDIDELSAIAKKRTEPYLNEVVYRAVIVGVSDYPGTSGDLVAAVNDAKAFKDALLQDPQWAESNITLLLDDDATKSNVITALETIAGYSDDNDVLVFYFAGSGTYAVTGGSPVGFLKTYGNTRTAYLSNSELATALSKVAAGSKQVILDAGQVPSGIEETSINYDAFINSLTNMTRNGVGDFASDRPAQVAVLTSGQNSAISPVGERSRTVFNTVLCDAITYYDGKGRTAEEAALLNEAIDPTSEKISRVVDADGVATPRLFVESDGRVAIDELASYLNSDLRLYQEGMKSLYKSTTEEQAIIMNGEWRETDVYDDIWLEKGAIIVTTTVDTVDAHDGKTSLREAAATVGKVLDRETVLENGADFTLGAGSVVTLGAYTGTLLEDVDVTYSKGSFKTTEACSLQVGSRTVEFAKPGVAVSWTSEDWQAGDVSLVDETGLDVAELTYNLRAVIGSTIVDKEEYASIIDLKDGDVLYTGVLDGQEAVVTKVGQSYRVLVDGVPYNRTTGLFYKSINEDGEVVYDPVTLSNYVSIAQKVTINTIIFDDSLAGQAITVDTVKGPVVFNSNAVINATSLEGELTFDGRGENSLLKIEGTELVSLIGVKITDASGAAIIIDEGADFELANSVVYGNQCGSAGLFANDGNLTLASCTIANNEGSGDLVSGTGTASIVNTIVALNDLAPNGFTYDDTSFVGSDDPGFVDPASDDYSLLKTSDAIDIGDNTAVELRCGVVLDYDFAGDLRYALGGTIDAGAYEYSVPMEDRETPSTVVTILDDVVDPTDDEISLREAIAYAGTTYTLVSDLQEGDVVTDENGVQYEVKNGRLVSFDGVSAIQYGNYYVVPGAFIVDAYGESTQLAEGEVVTLPNGTRATVVGTQLVYASGIPVNNGSTITLADGTVGTFSNGAVVDFYRNDRIAVALTQGVIDPSTPVAAFDTGVYILTYQGNGYFNATLQYTETDQQNNTTTTTFDATFKLVANTPFEFVDEDGFVTMAAKIATQKSVNLEDGRYVLINPLTETINGRTVTIYAAGAQLTLTRGVFTDNDGFVVTIPKGTLLSAPSGATVAYQASNFTAATLEEGTELTDAEGQVRHYKSGLSLYDEVQVGKTITFAKGRGLEGGTITLDRGAITVERGVTLDATLNSGLTIDADNASRVFTVNTYREPGALVTMNGLTLVNGKAEEGGLIYVAPTSNLKLTDSALSSAEATYGGAIYNAGRLSFEAATKAPTISGTTAVNGGAVYNAGTAALTGANISGVQAKRGGAVYNEGSLSVAGGSIVSAEAEYGGAVYNEGTATISKSAAITDSKALYFGGGVYNSNTLNVVNALFQRDSASNGGAIYNATGKASATNVKFFDNSASYGGAVYDAGRFLASRVNFAGNAALIQGAAVWSKGDATIVSSLAEANGLDTPDTSVTMMRVAEDGKMTLVNDTIAGNGYSAVFSDAANLIVYNSIIGDNNGFDLGANGGTLAVEYSMIENSTLGVSETNPVYAPNFKSFDKAGDWTTWNLMPGSGSEAIDAGSVDLAFYYNLNGARTALTVDYLGNARVSEGGITIGAYESRDVSETVSTVVTTFEDIVDPTDGLVSLREAIRYASTGKTVADRTVTFSPDLFPVDNVGTVYLSPDLQTITIDCPVIVTSEYTDEFGETAYRDITVDGSQSNAPLFLVLDGAEAEMRGLTFANGRASGENPSGGAFIVRDGELSVVDSKFVGNTADRNGGAIYQEGGSIFIVNALMTDNAANKLRGYGGAICQTGGRAFVYNTTIAANDAAVYGGVFASDGLFVMANSIVAGNGGAQSVDVYATNPELTNNFIGAMDAWKQQNGFNGNIIGTPLNVMDPQFVDAAGGDFHLENGSLAINSGSNAYAYGPDGVRLKFDLDANERVVGGVVDMGCYESVMADVPSTVVTSLADNIDQEDGSITLREAIQYAQQYGTPITFDLGEDFEGDAEIYLENGAIDVISDLVIDASMVPGGLKIVGSDDRIFWVHKSGSTLEDGSTTGENGNLTLKNVVLTGGSTTGNGGAVYMDGGEINFTNVLIYGNNAEKAGGAIYATGGKATLLNCTIAANEASDYPGAYFGGTTSLQNTIVATNAVEDSPSDHNYDLEVVGKLTSIASIVGAASATLSGAQNGFNGNMFGTTENIIDPGFAEPGSDDYSLAQNSIALNAGSNRLVGQPGYYASILQTSANSIVVRTDLAGGERIVGGTVDIGAYEFQLKTENPSVVVTTLLDVVDPYDGLISLREAVDYAGSAIYNDGVVTRVGRKITFDPSLTNGVIALQSPLEITKCVTIDAASMAGSITLDAGQTDEEFNALILAGKPDSVADEIWIAGITITGGKADYGAGVYHTTGKATLVNCLIYGNQATYGAGIASVAPKLLGESDANELKLVNVTVANNDSAGAYGGVWSIGGPISMNNTIVAKNTVNGEPGIDISISNVSNLASSLIGAASDNFARAWNGGSNMVGTSNTPFDPVFNDVENDDYSLVRSASGSMSPCINAGDNTLMSLWDGSVALMDAQNNLRVIGGVVDMGALESQMGPTELPSTLVTTLEDIVDPFDGLISLREAVAYANNYGQGNIVTFAPRLSEGTIYLKETLILNSSLTIDGLDNNAHSIVLTTADDVEDQRVLYVNSGDAIINGLTINNRYSERLQNGRTLDIDQGGGVYIRTGSLTMFNSLITDCAATSGSAIYVNEKSEGIDVKLINCTVVANVGLTSDANEGAAVRSDKGTLELWNTIVAANTLQYGEQAQDVYKVASGSGSGTSLSVLNSYIGFSDSVATYAGTAEKVGSLIGSSTNDLSLETQSMFVDLDNRDYNLVDTALATNAGNWDYLNESTIRGTFTSRDIEGKARVYYKLIEMGAFENQTAKDSAITGIEGTAVSLSVTTGRDTVDPSDGETSMREALALADQLMSRGYSDVVINVDTTYALEPQTIRVDSSLGALTINNPVTINGNGCTIDCGNAASGFVVQADGDVVISRVVIADGVAIYGGGIKLVQGNLTLDNSVIYDSSATLKGGGVYVASGATFKSYYSTIAKNVSVEGGGIYSEPGSTVELYNSIVARNRSSVIAANETDVILNGDYSINYSIIGNAGETAADAAKLLAKSTESQIGYGYDYAVNPVFVNETGGDFHLNVASDPASPAIGVGSTEEGMYYGLVDVTGTRIGGYSTSIGAYQIGRETPSTIVTTALDVVDPYDGLISLREAVTSYSYDNIPNAYGAAGCQRPYNSSYGAENAMNNPRVYKTIYYSPVTFDPSLAGQTIRLDPSLGPLTFDFRSTNGAVYDYLIDGSSLSAYGSGGITIDISDLMTSNLSGAFTIEGWAAPSTPDYRPVHLDIRNVTIKGDSDSVAFSVNQWGILSMHNCLVDCYDGVGGGSTLGSIGLCIYIDDNDSDQAGIAHIHDSTLIGSTNIGGALYLYNTILAGYSNVQIKQNNPSYRHVYVDNSLIYRTAGLGGRHSGNWAPTSPWISWQALTDGFVDFANHNYHLKAGSICINSGDPQYVQTLWPEHASQELSLDGIQRSIGVTDMGCYESITVMDVPSSVVTTDLDVVDYADGEVSLREAIFYAQQMMGSYGGRDLGGYCVHFDPSMAGKTIHLDSTIDIDKLVGIDGGDSSGNNLGITLDAGGNGSVFNVDFEADDIELIYTDDQGYARVKRFDLFHLTLTGGNTTGNGGAINIGFCPTVYLVDLDIYGNNATKYGGAIYSYDTDLTILNSRIGANNATYYGGVVNEFGRTVLTNSYVAENTSVIPDAGADLWGVAAVNYRNSKNNVVGYVADNIQLYDGVDGNRVGTAENPIRCFVNAPAGNLNPLPDYANAVLDEAFAELGDDLDVDLDVDL